MENIKTNLAFLASFLVIIGAIIAFTFVEAGGLPDLKITQFIYVQGECANSTNMTVRITATVKNIGNGTADNSTTRFNVVPIGGIQNKATPSLAAGASVGVKATYFCLPSGTYNLTATADIFNVVNESDETNNVKTDTFTV